MNYFVLEPEVAGGWGPATIADTNSHPPVVSQLEYEFGGWLENDILATFPCYIVTKRLYEQLRRTDMTGFDFAHVIISTSENFREIQSIGGFPTELPEFYWLKVHGQAGTDDFGITNDYRLCVSQAAMEVLRQFNLSQCDIESFTA